MAITTHAAGRGLAPLPLAALMAIGLLGSTVSSSAEDGPPGITKPTVFAPFNPNAPACRAPPGLAKVLAFAQDNEREFMQGVDRGLAMAAKDRGLEYRRALANNDAAKMVEQVQLFLSSKVGAVAAAPVDPASLSHSLQEIMWAGGYVSTIVPPPATSLLNAPQYATGKALTDAAATYIKTHLGGKANVVLLVVVQTL
jgi:ribose transport system substrate-binding protein